MKINRQWKFTLAYFIPVFVIFSLFTFFIIFSYSEQIYNLDEDLFDIAINLKKGDNLSTEINNIISEEDWNTLSAESIDQKLKKAGMSPIGFEDDEFYKLTPLEIEEIFRDKNIYLESNAYPIPTGNINMEHRNYPSISIEKLGIIQDNIYNALFRDIFSILFVITFVFALLAHFFARKSLQPLEQALVKQKEFISDASHEIKTPLALMKSEAEVLLRNKKSSLTEYASFAKNTVDDVNRLDGLTNNLLELAQLNKNNDTTIQEKIFLKEICKSISKKITSTTKEKQIDVKINIDKDISVLANNDKITQILHIILDNSVKYADKNSDIIVQAETKGKYIQLIIENRGETIPKKDLPHLFDRFYRVSKDRNKKGYGLGLAIAKGIITQQGGTIEIQSENKRTQVILNLKIKS